MQTRFFLLAAAATSLLAVAPAQSVTAIPAMTVPHSLIDMDAVGPAGPTDLNQINNGGAPGAGNIARILLTPSAAAAGVYNTNPQGLALGLVAGNLELVAPPTGAFDAFDARIDLSEPATQFGLGVGDWNTTMDLDFYLGSTLVVSYTTPSYSGATAPQFFEMTDGCFDRVDIRASAITGNWVITDLAVESCARELSTTFPANNGLSTPANYLMTFDVDVAYPAGIEVTSLVINSVSPLGTVGTIDIHIRRGTSLGFNTSPTGWHTQMTGLPVISAGDQNRAYVQLDHPILLGPGVTGVGVVYNNIGVRYDSGTTVHSDGCITLTGHERTATPFAAGAVANRSFSGALCYRLAGPDILAYQFDEPYGNEVGNTATGSAAPARGAVNTSGWQGSTGRSLFEWEGCGQLSYTGTPNTNLVNSGYALNHTGDMTIMWWQRMQAPSGGGLSYAFGGAGTGWRCFTGGVAGTAMWYRGSGIGDLQSTTDIQSLTGWQHMAIVIDDVNGVGTFYLNGEPDGTLAFTPGLHAPSNPEVHVGYSTSTTSSTWPAHADLDDFRMYSKALTVQELKYSMKGESSSTSTLGRGCPDRSGSVPSISGRGGVPSVTTGNPYFGITMSGGTPGSLWGNTVDFSPKANGFIPIPQLGGGCVLQIGWNDVSFGVVSPTGTADRPFAIPVLPVFRGTHFYSQFIVLNLPFGQGQMSDVLNCNAQ